MDSVSSIPPLRTPCGLRHHWPIPKTTSSHGGFFLPLHPPRRPLLYNPELLPLAACLAPSRLTQCSLSPCGSSTGVSAPVHPNSRACPIRLSSRNNQGRMCSFARRHTQRRLHERPPWSTDRPPVSSDADAAVPAAVSPASGKIARSLANALRSPSLRCPGLPRPPQ